VPTNRVSLARGEPWLVLALELPASSEFESYRVTLARVGGAPIWSRNGLRQTAPDTLAIAMNASLLTAGDYLISLDGHTRAGRDVPAGRYPFRFASR
jgi:hypothetical protein